MDLTSLSRAVSHALRHEPWLYELELDPEGWVAVDALLAALQGEDAAWSALAASDLERMIERSEKKRHELCDGKIRAFYGHSTARTILKNQGDPPTVLYHGTSAESAAIILSEGLKPMGRQYVHLSADAETALRVGLRKAKAPVILRIDTRIARANGIAFYHGNEKVWLADAVPATFIEDGDATGNEPDRR